MNSDKKVLDACCGGRMMWFDKSNPEAIFVDIRRVEKGFVEARPNFSVQPDLVADFRSLPFADNTFKLIAWDPPHFLSLGSNSYMCKKYGKLQKDEWRADFTKGFDELWRVLDVNGTLIFKWNESEIPLRDVLACFKEKPLFGHPTSKQGKTMWMTFFKSERRVRG